MAHPTARLVLLAMIFGACATTTAALSGVDEPDFVQFEISDVAAEAVRLEAAAELETTTSAERPFDVARLEVTIPAAAVPAEGFTG